MGRDLYGENPVPVGRTFEYVRCANPVCAGPAADRGGKPALIAELVSSPWRIQCWRCKHINASSGHLLRYPGSGA